MYDCRMASGKIQSWASIKLNNYLNVSDGTKLYWPLCMFRQASICNCKYAGQLCEENINKKGRLGNTTSLLG